MDHHEGYDSSDYEQVHENKSEESEQEVQEIESTLITKPKTKSAVWNFFRVDSDSDGHPSNTNKPICCKCMEPVLPVMEIQVIFSIIYAVNIHWFPPKFTTKRSARRRCHLQKVAVNNPLSTFSV